MLSADRAGQRRHRRTGDAAAAGQPSLHSAGHRRTRLASLIDRHGARHLPLGVLTRAEARALLAARLSTDHVAAEPDAADELIDLCGGYPLALSITARNAATRPGSLLVEVAAELRELGLEMLDHDTGPAASLPTVLSWSLHRLSTSNVAPACATTAVPAASTVNDG